MRILVTGGAGFIGSHLVDAYLERGDEVAIIDNLATGLKKNVNSKAKFYEVDITDKQATKNAVLDFKPEVINHHAAHLSIRESVEDPRFNATVNILGFLNVMESARTNGLKKIIVASSGGAVYGDASIIPTPESYPNHPVSPYGVTKLAAEHYLHYYKSQYNIDWVAMRYSNVYGPRQNPKGETGVIATFLEQMVTDKQPIIFGDGEQTRDYVFISDVINANLLALEKGGGPYNIGTGLETSVIEVFNLLQNKLKTNFQKQHGLARPGETKRSALDISAAKTGLLWEPGVKLEEGIEQTISWYKANF